jgi:hypothetical protein
MKEKSSLPVQQLYESQTVKERANSDTNKTCKGRNMNDVDVTNKLTANIEVFNF